MAQAQAHLGQPRAKRRPDLTSQAVADGDSEAVHASTQSRAIGISDAQGNRHGTLRASSRNNSNGEDSGKPHNNGGNNGIRNLDMATFPAGQPLTCRVTLCHSKDAVRTSGVAGGGTGPTQQRPARHP